MDTRNSDSREPRRATHRAAGASARVAKAALGGLLAALLLAVSASAQNPQNDWATRVERLLGGPCRPLVPGDVETTCGMNQRVAVVELPVDYLLVPPESAERVLDAPAGDARRQGHRIVALAGDRLWVHDVTCGACRRVMGTTFVVELRFAPPDALLALQQRLGLPAERPLTTAREWRAAVRRAGPAAGE